VKMPATVYRQLLEVALVDDLPRNTLLDATFNPSKSAIKEAIKAGREVTGADVRFGRNRLVVR